MSESDLCPRSAATWLLQVARLIQRSPETQSLNPPWGVTTPIIWDPKPLKSHHIHQNRLIPFDSYMYKFTSPLHSSDIHPAASLLNGCVSIVSGESYPLHEYEYSICFQASKPCSVPL